MKDCCDGQLWTVSREGTHVFGVLGSDAANLEHSKARLHKDDQHRSEEQPSVVDVRHCCPVCAEGYYFVAGVSVVFWPRFLIGE